MVSRLKTQTQGCGLRVDRAFLSVSRSIMWRYVVGLLHYFSYLYPCQQRAEELIEVFVRFLFSSRVELGWDESMNRIGPQVYEIRVKDKLYTTTKKLCDISAEEIEGRATRVWEAESEDKTRVVLKDVWLDESRRPEHELIKEVLKKEEDKKLRDYMTKSFFTVVDFERVKIGDQEDTTKRTILRGLWLRDDCEFLRICADSFVSMPLETLGTPPATGMSRNHSIKFSAAVSRRVQYRYHYRIVFKEAATPLYSVNNMGKVFSTCRDAMFGEYFIDYNGVDVI